MELGEYVATLRKRWLIIAVLALLGGGAGYANAAMGTPMYRSSSTVYVSLTRGDSVSEFLQGTTYTQNLVQSFVQLASLPVVLDPVIEELDLPTTARRLAGSVQADSPLDTQIIEISAVSADPDRAAAIANAVARELSRTVRDLSPTSADGAAALEMTVVAEAVAPLAPFSPRPRMDGALGAAVGIAAGVLFALLRAQLDTRVRTVKDLPTAPARAVLGQVPHEGSLGKRPLVVLDDPHSPVAESYRRLRTNLQFLDAERPVRSVVVTSSVPNEGKSTTAVNLALVLAERGARVLLVDADLRSPSVAALCGLEGGAGLSEVLIREAELADLAQPWGLPGLDVLTAGRLPPNPSQLVDSEAMAALLRHAGEEYDFVVLDTPPLLALTDAAVLSRRTDGAVVVARSRKVRRPDLQEALATLDSVGATCLGLLVNDTTSSRTDLRYGYGQHATARRGVPFRHRAGARPARRTGRRAAPAAGRPTRVDELLTGAPVLDAPPAAEAAGTVEPASGPGVLEGPPSGAAAEHPVEHPGPESGAPVTDGDRARPAPDGAADAAPPATREAAPEPRHAPPHPRGSEERLAPADAVGAPARRDADDAARDGAGSAPGEEPAGDLAEVPGGSARS